MPWQFVPVMNDQQQGGSHITRTHTHEVTQELRCNVIAFFALKKEARKRKEFGKR